jgi:hypothetical protein
MAFSERMRQLLDQSIQVMSKAGEKAQDWGERGLAASKDLANKAGAKAQDLGERGVLKLEIMRLEAQAQKLIGRLGSETYGALVEQQEKTLSADSPALKPLLDELASVRAAIEKRETDLQNR